MKNIIPEIFVNNCKEALEFYRDAFGGEIKNVQTGENKPMFKGLEDKVIHSELHVNSVCIIYFMDILGEQHEGINSQTLLDFDNEEEINKVYSKLKEGGSIRFELQRTFWGALHGVVEDKYGNTWSLNFSQQ